MGDFGQEAKRLLELSLATNTIRAYQVALKSFENFRHLHLLQDIWPVPFGHLVQYIGYLSLNKRSPATALQHIAAISRQHKLNAMLDSTDNFIIKKILTGMKNSNPRQDIRHPITLPVLRNLLRALDYVCSSVYESKLFKSMFTMAFHAFLRVSELVCTEVDPGKSKGLLLSDIRLTKDQLVVCIRLSKTDQLGAKCCLRIPSHPDKFDCPAVTLHQYLIARPSTSPDTSLFIHIDSKPVSKYQFNAVLKRALSFINLSCSSYKSHSFRIGAATSAAVNGIPYQIIQEWGRWKSMAYRTYIRIGLIN